MTTQAESKDTEAAEEKAPEQTPEEIAAAEKIAAAEARAEAAESAAALLKAEREQEKKKGQHPKGGYSLASFQEAEWAEAEAQTGLDRKTLLANLNIKASIQQETMSTLETMEAQYAVKDELQEALDADPLSPKFKAEARKFIGDIPGDLLKTPEGRKKWISKAVAFAKSQVKLPASGRKSESMDTKETGTIKDKIANSDLSVEEKEIIESHGRTAADYEKMRNPYIKDSTVHRYREEAPKFGPK